jgi:hypothetical protein
MADPKNNKQRQFHLLDLKLKIDQNPVLLQLFSSLTMIGESNFAAHLASRNP